VDGSAQRSPQLAWQIVGAILVAWATFTGVFFAVFAIGHVSRWAGAVAGLAAFTVGLYGLAFGSTRARVLGGIAALAALWALLVVVTLD
jgi:hypothetical protein